MNSHPSANHGPRFRSPGLFCVLVVLLGLAGLTGRAASIASTTVISLQAQINQLEALIEASGTITRSQQSQLDSLLAGLEAARKQSNAALNELDKLIDDANNTAGGTVINDPGLDPVTAPVTAEGAMNDLLRAIDVSSPDLVKEAMRAHAGLLASALADPANARRVADALANMQTNTGDSVDARDAANVAYRIALLASGLDPNSAALSASLMAAAVSNVISRPEVISADPGMVAHSAASVSATTGNAKVSAADPTAAAKVAKQSAAIANNPAVKIAAPQLVATINTNVGLINNTPSVSVLLGLTTNQQPLDVTTVSTSS